MDSVAVKNAVEPRSVDPVWTRIRDAAQVAAASEPVLAGIDFVVGGVSVGPPW